MGNNASQVKILRLMCIDIISDVTLCPVSVYSVMSYCLWLDQRKKPQQRRPDATPLEPVTDRCVLPLCTCTLLHVCVPNPPVWEETNWLMRSTLKKAHRPNLHRCTTSADDPPSPAH